MCYELLGYVPAKSNMSFCQRTFLMQSRRVMKKSSVQLYVNGIIIQRVSIHVDIHEKMPR